MFRIWVKMENNSYKWGTYGTEDYNERPKIIFGDSSKVGFGSVSKLCLFKVLPKLALCIKFSFMPFYFSLNTSIFKLHLLKYSIESYIS